MPRTLKSLGLAPIARKMSNPDAVLNELLQVFVCSAAESEAEMFSGESRQPQQIANDAGELLQDFLNRWSAWMDIEQGGNSQAATALVIDMIHDTETEESAQEGDAERLWPLATWIESRLSVMGSAFDSMT